MINALIIDDELHAREEMTILLQETGAINVMDTCSNSIDALKFINHHKPDVLFLDIQMPVIDGFELLNMIHSDLMPHVVFVTAYDQYSLKAFEEEALDYLLKPVDRGRLAKTITKLQKLIGEKQIPRFEAEEIKRIPCLLGKSIKLINIDVIEYVTSTPTGVHVVTPKNEYYTDVTLKVLEERSGLNRCHKQFLVNLETVSEIILLEIGRANIKTKSGKKVPVSRRYLKKLKKKLLL